jgi:TonB family protein
MIKITFIFLGLLTLSLNVKGQDKVLLYYNSEWEITKKQSAAYYREAEYDLENFRLDGKVFDYDTSGVLVMEGNYVFGKKNGDFTFNHLNGKTESRGKYLDNRRAGNWEYYHANGRLKQIIYFSEKGEKNDFAVLEFYDSNGNQLIKNGTGKWINDSIQSGLFDPHSLKRLTGQFKDSLKTGEWQLTRLSDGVLMHSERFKKGKFLGATVFNTDFKYTGTMTSEMVDKLPEPYIVKFRATEQFKLDKNSFPEQLVYADVETIFRTITGKEFKINNRKVGYADGDYSLLEFIAKNITFPMSAVNEKVNGKVYVSVIVDSQGNTKDVKILKSLQKDVDNEAIRVIRLIKKWLPEIQDGKPVESTITIPVKFEAKG